MKGSELRSGTESDEMEPSRNSGSIQMTPKGKHDAVGSTTQAPNGRFEADDDVKGRACHIKSFDSPSEPRSGLDCRPNRQTDRGPTGPTGPAATGRASETEPTREVVEATCPESDKHNRKIAAYRTALELSRDRIESCPYDVGRVLSAFPTLHAAYQSSLPWLFSQKGLVDLPSEALLRILDFLRGRDRHALAHSCRALRRRAQEHKDRKFSRRAGLRPKLVVEDGFVSFNAVLGEPPAPVIRPTDVKQSKNKGMLRTGLNMLGW
jgi:hypothetical protein